MSSVVERTDRDRGIVTIVVPVFDEVQGLDELHALLSDVDPGKGRRFEIIYVDDGSSDGTSVALDRLHERDQRVTVLHLRRRFGKSAALEAGFRAASGSVIVTLDGDLQDDPRDIPALLARLDEGDGDMVVGHRTERHLAPIRRVLVSLFNQACRWACGEKLHDFGCPVRCFDRQVIEEVSIYGELHRYLPLLAQWRGFRLVEHPVRSYARRYGHSKFGLSRFVKALFDFMTVGMLTRFNKSPLYVFGFLGISLTAIGFAVNGYLSVLWFTGTGIGTRPLLLFGVLLMIVGLQTTFFGLLAELIVHAGSSSDTYAIAKIQSHDSPSDGVDEPVAEDRGSPCDPESDRSLYPGAGVESGPRATSS